MQEDRRRTSARPGLPLAADNARREALLNLENVSLGAQLRPVNVNRALLLRVVTASPEV